VRGSMRSQLTTGADVSPELVSTSLAHIAHILVLASHYLGIRLPAEITLPHRDYPRPTVFSLGSSYRHGPIAFPGSAIGAQPVTGAVGDGQGGHVPRPRPLFLDKPLATLAKEDPPGYSLFLEGVALLAHNIAWACWSQGVSFGDKDSYEDISNMGQNLWRLLIGDTVHRRSVEPTFPPSGNGPREGENSEMAKPKSMIGRWSHGTTYAFLGGAEGLEMARNFKILSPLKLVDRLKKRLSSEAPMLEWETIEEHEVEDVQTMAGAGNAGNPTEGNPTGGGNPTRGVGNSGWTKVKTR
jgi:hypothetical protein